MMPRVAAALLALILVFVTPVAAQSGNEGSIEGTVLDPSGAVVGEAKVMARNLGTGAAFNTVTDERGAYRFLVLPVGSYEVRVSHPGFMPLTRTEVAVTVGAKVNLFVVLRVGSQAESVTVSSEAPLVETTRAALSTTVDQRSIANLPLNGRLVLDLIYLTPAVTTAPSGPAFGGRDGLGSTVIDGGDHNGFGPGVAVGSASLRSESVQEFQVNLNSYSAESGRSGTAIVNVITKSGTNDFHGSLSWYYRDHGLNATGYINKLNGQPKDQFHVHQFGGALGGPVIKDKLFFYFAYDGQRRGEENLTVLNLPAAFTLSPDPVVAGDQQAALDYLHARDGPYARRFDNDTYFAKMDWQIRPIHRLSVRWGRQLVDNANAANAGPQESLEHTGDVGNTVDSVSASLTSQLSPSRVNVARFSYVANLSPQTANSNNPEASVFEGGQQVLLVGHVARLPVDNGVQRFEATDTLSMSKGAHALKFGGQLVVDRGVSKSGLNFFGAYRFGSLENFGRSLAGATGMATRYNQAFSGLGMPPIDVHPNFVYIGGFFQDEWRVRRSFTLSYGLRYETQLTNSSSVHNPSPGLAAAGVDTAFFPDDTNNFAPRLGLAWNPLANNRLVIRGGYGLYFPRLLGNTAARAFTQNGITVQTRSFSGAAIPAYPNTVCGPPDPTGAPPDCPTPKSGTDIIQAFSSDYRQSVVQQASFGVEYEVVKDLAISATYLFFKGDHLLHWQDINLDPPGTGVIGVAGTTELLSYRLYSSTRPIPGFDRVLLLKANGNSNYHGLVIQAVKRWSHNFQFLGSYTLSKVIDDNPSPGANSPPGGDITYVMDPLEPRLDRGIGYFDLRHRLVFSGVWDLHYADRLRQPARVLLSGWEIGGILVASSGVPYPGFLNFDLNNDGNAATDRAPGVGRNTFNMPATVWLDSRVTREVALKERMRLLVSWDAFNLFNRVNISDVRATQFTRSQNTGQCTPAATYCLTPNPAFGAPTATLDPRIMQFSARLQF